MPDVRPGSASEIVRRYLVWGDKRHWEITVGRTSMTRWCSGKLCHLPGSAVRHHWVTVRRFNRSWSAGDR